MRSFRAAATAVMLAGVLPFAPTVASATACTATDATEADPHLTDFTNDWEGVIGGNQTALVPYGDVYMESTDLISGWLNLSGTGAWTANIRTVRWLGLESNAVINFLWTYDDGVNPIQARRFVSAQLQRSGAGFAPRFQFGYIDQTGEIDFITPQGQTTGAVTIGPNGEGEFRIDIPMNRMGNPPAGATLGGIVAESRVLVGASGTGLLGVADITDFFPCEDVTIPL